MLKKTTFAGHALAERITVEPRTGCWLWTGALIGTGTPVIRKDLQQINVRRLIFEETAEVELTDQEAQLIRIGCSNKTKRCVNPHHIKFIGKEKDLLNGLLPDGS